MELRKRHKAHARPLKNLDERYEWYADHIELDADSRKGGWIEAFHPAASSLHLDLGCGKGRFATQMALRHPDVLFIGLDYDRTCIALAAQKAHELELPNCVFALADGEDVTGCFDEEEVGCIHLNFSTPHPRKKHAGERLTHVDQLIAMRKVLSRDGSIELKTDSPPFFEFSLVQFDMAGYDVVWKTTDLHSEDADAVTTEYEERLTNLGAKVHALRAVKADRPVRTAQEAELSLFEYLPEDLDALEYVPFGMEGYVFNMRNRRAKKNARTID